jgi:septation ring formation regulator EzrA
MERKQINELIEKYRKMSTQELKYGEEKCAYFDRLVGQIEESFDEYLDDFYETEDDVINDIKESFYEVDDSYDYDE